eukprot:scaffold91004_cov53-Prasinocladus_malaysianus.AAC.1
MDGAKNLGRRLFVSLRLPEKELMALHQSEAQSVCVHPGDVIDIVPVLLQEADHGVLSPKGHVDRPVVASDKWAVV